jgi:hypothetical protein
MQKTIILISGKARSGKGTLADYLEKEFILCNHSATHKLISQNIKDYCSADFTALSDYLRRYSDEISSRINVLFDYITDHKLDSYLREIDLLLSKFKINRSNWYENKTELSRLLLQIYGTDIMQNRVDENFWNKKMEDEIKKLDYEFIIISDCRFRTNIEWMSNIDDVLSYTIRVDRNVEQNNHISERDLNNYHDWNFEIDNNGSLDDLFNSSKQIAKSILYDKSILDKPYF